MRRDTGPSQQTRLVVQVRDHGRCALCGEAIGGPYSIQHRRARGMGGSRFADTNSPANLVLVDGTGTTGCHGWLEANPDKALELGFRVPQGNDPSKWAIQHATHGTVYLLHDGTWVPVDADYLPDGVA